MTITLGNFMADLMTSVQGVFDSMLPVVYLLLGIFLTFWIVSFVIDKVRDVSDKDSGIVDLR